MVNCSLVKRIKLHGQKQISALTILEMLISCVVVLIIVMVALGAVSHLLHRAEQATAAANIRQMGTAILASTKDRSGILPGPLWPGQIPFLEPGRSGRLVVELADYLGLRADQRQEIRWMISHAYRRNIARHLRVEDYRTHVMNMSVNTANGPLNPWGSLAANGGQPLPLATIERPSNVWMLSDADQQHPAVASAVWRNFTPPRPIHDRGRLHLFFDGSVRFVTP